MIPLGLMGYAKDSGLYIKCDRKPFDGDKHGSAAAGT